MQCVTDPGTLKGEASLFGNHHFITISYRTGWGGGWGGRHGFFSPLFGSLPTVFFFAFSVSV